jgi:hypothetical protein
MRAILTLLALFATVQAFALTDQEVVDLFNEANTLFREANETSERDAGAARDLYRRAALRYERITREGGIQNGQLFYNIGNAYFRSEDLGRAILNYRRAEMYMPDDASLTQNLQFARSRRLDRFEEAEETKVLHTLLFWHYDVSPSIRSTLFVILSGFFWIGATVRLRRRQLVPVWGLVISGLLAALLLGSLVVDSTSGADRHSGVVLAQQVVARKGDGNSYEPSFTEPLHAGTEFRLIDERQDWLQIQLPDGRECWVPSEAAGLVGRS